MSGHMQSDVPRKTLWAADGAGASRPALSTLRSIAKRHNCLALNTEAVDTQSNDVTHF